MPLRLPLPDRWSIRCAAWCVFCLAFTHLLAIHRPIRAQYHGRVTILNAAAHPALYSSLEVVTAALAVLFGAVAAWLWVRSAARKGTGVQSGGRVFPAILAAWIAVAAVVMVLLLIL